jgi:hypothetical protein
MRSPFLAFTGINVHKEQLADSLCEGYVRYTMSTDERSPAAPLPGSTAVPPMVPAVPPVAPRPLRFLFISKWGLIHDLAWELRKEGQEVRYHIMMKSEREVAEGFVEKVDRWEDSKEWADVIVFDDC